MISEKDIEEMFERHFKEALPFVSEDLIKSAGAGFNAAFILLKPIIEKQSTMLTTLKNEAAYGLYPDTSGTPLGIAQSQSLKRIEIMANETQKFVNEKLGEMRGKE